MKNRIINVQDVPISILQQELDEYICITDIAKAKTGESRSAATLCEAYDIEEIAQTFCL